MESIAHSVGLVQGERIEMREFGIKATFKAKVRGKHLDGVKRGKIRNWSANSVRRLREVLLSKHVPDSQVVGITLTVPWRDPVPDIDDVFRASIKRFRVAFIRAYPNSAAVYRVELQQRGMPHLHMITYFGKGDTLDVGKILLLWWKHGFLDLRDGSMDGYLKHGVKCEVMGDNVTRLVQYLCDHASKRKQAQLGWQGRQWGVIASRNLSPRPSIDLPPFSSARSEGYFWRLIHRLTRYRVKGVGSCPFGYHYTRPRRIYGVTFGVSPATARRCFALAESH